MTKVWVRPQLFPAYICPQNNIPKLWGGVEGTLPDCYPLYFIQWAFSHLKLGTRWAQSQQHCSEPTAQRQQDEMIKANGVTQPPHAWTSHPSPQPALWPHQMLTKGVRREEQSPKAACQPAPHQTKAQKQFYPCPLGLRLYFKKREHPNFLQVGAEQCPLLTVPISNVQNSASCLKPSFLLQKPSAAVLPIHLVQFAWEDSTALHKQCQCCKATVGSVLFS